MPTGYTSNIANGITFKQFAYECMRAFGACVTIRDDPAAPIPENFEAGNYHVERIQEREEELNNVLTMALADAEEAAEDDYNETQAHLLEMIDEARALRKSYEAMLEQVEAWTPPTPEHDNFKTFMRDQIKMSIDCDCSEEYYLRSLKELRKLTGMEWMDRKADEIRNSLDYHQRSFQREAESASRSTEWVKAVRDTFI